MSIDNQPANKNYLSPLGFRLVLGRTPTVEYFCQAATLPTVSIAVQDIPGPSNPIPYPGTRIEFGEATLRFKVDEDLTNYQEMLDWMFMLGAPENPSQYAAGIGPRGRSGDWDSQLYSDGRIVVLTSHGNPAFSIHFKRMFPTSLSPLQFDTTLQDVQHLEADVSFRYTSFVIDTV